MAQRDACYSVLEKVLQEHMARWQRALDPALKHAPITETSNSQLELSRQFMVPPSEYPLDEQDKATVSWTHSSRPGETLEVINSDSRNLILQLTASYIGHYMGHTGVSVHLWSFDEFQ